MGSATRSFGKRRRRTVNGYEKYGLTAHTNPLNLPTDSDNYAPDRYNQTLPLFHPCGRGFLFWTRERSSLEQKSGSGFDHVR